MTNLEIASMIDHTVLKATATEDDVKKVCKEALENNFASVCINTFWVKKVSEILKSPSANGGHVKTCTVIDFPLGAGTTETKVFQTKDAIKNGAEEIDMVINVGLVKMHDYEAVEKDIAAVVEAANGLCVKVILETCYLTKEEIIAASKAALNAKACFVKTSTGFGTYGARAEDVKIMKETVGDALQVKASGGIRDKATALQMIENGATRLGCSAGIAIIAEN